MSDDDNTRSLTYRNQIETGRGAEAPGPRVSRFEKVVSRESKDAFWELGVLGRLERVMVGVELGRTASNLIELEHPKNGKKIAKTL